MYEREGMNALIVVAGGSGRRMGHPVPKQYLELGARPVIVHTIERFYSFDPHMQVVVVIDPVHREYWERAAAHLDPGKEVLVCEGGSERFDSVRNGLALVPDGVIVGIHDAVRPLVNVDTIGRCYDSAGASGSGIPVTEMDVSVRQVESDTGGGERSRNLERSGLRKVQTPQTFRSELIREAYRRVKGKAFTDDASVFEAVFGELNLVEGNSENIKITTAADLQLASLLI